MAMLLGDLLIGPPLQDDLAEELPLIRLQGRADLPKDLTGALYRDIVSGEHGVLRRDVRIQRDEETAVPVE